MVLSLPAAAAAPARVSRPGLVEGLGYTALHVAAKYGRVDCVMTLVARGARLDLIAPVRPAAAARPPHVPPQHHRAAADDDEK